jgi:23S rRNA-intervening sequence protein
MGNYRQLEVWQRAQRFALTIYRSTEAFPMRERYGLASQMRRAAVSVASKSPKAVAGMVIVSLHDSSGSRAARSTRSNVNSCLPANLDT